MKWKVIYLPEEMGLPTEGEENQETDIVRHEIEGQEPTTQEFIMALRTEIKPLIEDEEAYISIEEQFVTATNMDEFDKACGYLRTVSYEFGIDEQVEELLAKHNLQDY